ncbi:hypothetical protein ACC698_38020, partial [Rhizobium johnstonii]
AAANGLAPVPKLEFFSLTLLQGSFSHNGFAKEIKPGLTGAFPDVVGIRIVLDSLSRLQVLRTVRPHRPELVVGIADALGDIERQA